MVEQSPAAQAAPASAVQVALRPVARAALPQAAWPAAGERLADRLVPAVSQGLAAMQVSAPAVLGGLARAAQAAATQGQNRGIATLRAATSVAINSIMRFS